MITEHRGIPGLPEPTGPFTQVVSAEGRLVFVSGQVALAADGTVIGGGDAATQAQQCLDYLDRALMAAGAARPDVAKVTVYLTDIADRAAVAEVRTRYFGGHRPAATLVEVSALATPELLVEIEAIAVISGA